MNDLFASYNAPVLTKEHWHEVTSNPLKIMKTFRFFECVYYVLLAIVVYYSLESADFASLEVVEVYNVSSGISALNPRFASPIKLNNQDCTPYDLYPPMCKAQQSSHGTLSHCCTELFDKNAWPTQTVTSPENYTILFCVSLVLLLIRVGLWKCVYLPKRGHSLVASIDLRYWVLILWDQYVTMMIAAVFAGLMTNYMKLLVGSPRPCYYALQLFSSVHITDREKLESTSHTSFVSGHAASAATVMSVVCLLFLADIQHIRDHQPAVAFGLTQLMLVPITVAAWIGLTRIEDFWHFETDVVGGWLVGAGSAWLAYVCVAGYCRAEVMHETVFVLCPPLAQRKEEHGEGHKDMEKLSIVSSDLASSDH